MDIKKSSIKINYVLNVSRLFLNIVILAFSMPYISRVLGSEGIGRVEYANAIIEYFFLFSALGIPVYGIRQIAKCRDNVRERSCVVIELLLLLAFTTVLAYIALYFLLQLMDFNPDFKRILSFLSIGIVLSNFGVEWFYQGIENQKYITIRFIFIKLISLILLFMLVKSPEDTYYYALFLIITNFGGSIFNLLYIKKFISLDRETLKNLNIKRHLWPSLTIFIASISISIYMQLDKIMLGSMVSESAVGYYTQAVKLPRQALLLVTTMGAVMLPRLSSLLHTGNRQEYIVYMSKSLKYMLLIAVPITVIFLLLAKEIILLMAGEDFIPSIITMQISAPIVLIVALAYYVGFQVLYPSGQERIYTISVTIAAVVNFIFNLLIIKHMQQDGAALGTIIAEFTGLTIMIIAARRSLTEVGFFKLKNCIYLIAGGVMALTIYVCSYLHLLPIFQIIISSITGVSAYFIVLYILKETTIYEILSLVSDYTNKK